MTRQRNFGTPLFCLQLLLISMLGCAQAPSTLSTMSEPRPAASVDTTLGAPIQVSSRRTITLPLGAGVTFRARMTAAIDVAENRALLEALARACFEVDELQRKFVDTLIASNEVALLSKNLEAVRARYGDSARHLILQSGGGSWAAIEGSKIASLQRSRSYVEKQREMQVWCRLLFGVDGIEYVILR